MSLHEKMEKALYGKVKRKANKTRNLSDLRGKLNRVLAKKPEVMVKITGFSKGSGGVKASLEYITRNGKVELEDSRGNKHNGREAVNEFFDEWDNFNRKGRNENQRDAMKMVLSMPEGTNPELLKKAARDFVKNEFSANHEYAFALHTDDKHPHVHIIVKTLGFDQKRLNPRKADIQNWRENFAEKLRDNGIEAEATPRVIRGVVKKSEAQVLRHLEQSDAKRKPRVSTVKESQKKAVIDDLNAEKKGVYKKPMAWDRAINKQREEVKKAWDDLASELEKQNTNEDMYLARQVRIFADYLPAAETNHDKMKRDIKRNSKQERER